MFELMGAFLWLLITGVASITGYITVKRFVQNRLRFVDAIHKRYLPALAGVLATGIALPIVAPLPIIGIGTALLFGIGVGSGLAAGQRGLKRLPGA